MMRLAEEFAQAADALRRTDAAIRAGNDPLKVPLYLYGHALELMAKAVLVCVGTDEEDLRRIGHDLVHAFREIRRRPGAIDLHLSARDHALIGMLGVYYEAKDLEYVATGFRRYPLPVEVGTLTNRLRAQLLPAVNRDVRAWLRSERT